MAEIVEVHMSIGGWGNNFYLTPCGLSDGNYWVTHDKQKVTCKKCLEALEPKPKDKAKKQD
ncbi:hypothetical protein [Actinomycetia phage DSL-LC01]|nr:hypothetical protein [Actinomycetia phage DSL-LC01]